MLFRSDVSDGTTVAVTDKNVSEGRIAEELAPRIQYFNDAIQTKDFVPVQTMETRPIDSMGELNER